MGYTVEKPNFCISCGSPISIYAKGKTPQSKIKNQPTVEEGYEFDEELDIETNPEDRIPDLQGLDCEIESTPVRRNTLGQIIENQPEGGGGFNLSEEFGHLSNNPNQTEEEFMKAFQKEAGSLRDNNEDNA